MQIMRSNKQDPTGELTNLEHLLAEHGEPLGATYDYERQLLDADKFVIQINPRTGGQSLRIRVEVTTNPNLAQRMDSVPRVEPYIADYALQSNGSWLNEQTGRPYSSREIAEDARRALRELFKSCC